MFDRPEVPQKNTNIGWERVLVSSVRPDIPNSFRSC